MNPTKTVPIEELELIANNFKKKLLEIKAVADNSQESTESRIMVIRQMLDNLDFIKSI
jgi:hypothetical protein